MCIWLHKHSRKHIYIYMAIAKYRYKLTTGTRLMYNIVLPPCHLISLPQSHLVTLLTYHLATRPQLLLGREQRKTNKTVTTSQSSRRNHTPDTWNQYRACTLTHTSMHRHAHTYTHNAHKRTYAHRRRTAAGENYYLHAAQFTISSETWASKQLVT